MNFIINYIDKSLSVFINRELGREGKGNITLEEKKEKCSKTSQIDIPKIPILFDLQSYSSFLTNKLIVLFWGCLLRELGREGKGNISL